MEPSLMNCAICRECCIGILLVVIVEESLEIRSHLNIHAWCLARMNILDLVFPRGEETIKNVVLICRNDKAINRQGPSGEPSNQRRCCRSFPSEPQSLRHLAYRAEAAYRRGHNKLPEQGPRTILIEFYGREAELFFCLKVAHQLFHDRLRIIEGFLQWEWGEIFSAPVHVI